MKKSILKTIAISTSLIIVACNGEEVETTPAETSQETDTAATVSQNTLVTESDQLSEDVNAETFKSLVDTGSGILIDVRTPEEYNNGHMEGAVNMDFNGADFEKDLDLLSKDRPVYVYCQAGGRSGQAKELMKEKGFTAVYNLTGGYGNWPYKE